MVGCLTRDLVVAGLIPSPGTAAYQSWTICLYSHAPVAKDYNLVPM